MKKEKPMKNVNAQIRRITINNGGLQNVTDNPYTKELQRNIEPSSSPVSIELEVVLEKLIEPEIFFELTENDSFVEELLRVEIIESKNPQSTYEFMSTIDGLTPSQINGIVTSFGMKKRSLYLSLANEEEEEDLINSVFRTTFSYENFPTNLSYILLTYFDFGSIEKRFNIVVPDSIKNMYKNASFFAVTNHGNVTDSLYAFFDSNGDEYLGAVEIINEVAYKIGTQERLTSKDVFNDIIVDQRSVDDVFKLENSLEDKNLFLENYDNLLTYLPVMDSYEPMDMEKRYFNSFITIDEKDKVRGAIYFDLFLFIKTNSRFGYTLTERDLESNNQILSLSKIKQVKISRRRVDKIRMVNSLGAKYDSFEEGDYPLETACLNQDFFQNIMRPKSTFNMDKVLTGKSTGIEDLSNSIRKIGFSDEFKSKISKGIYEYVVEMTVVDGTIEKLGKDIAILNRLYKEFQSYKNEAEKKNNLYKKSSKVNRNFFKKTIESEESYIWNRVCVELLDVMSTYYTITDTSIMDNFIKLIHPLTATVESLEGFSSIFSDFLGKLNELKSSVRFVDDLRVTHIIGEKVDSELGSGTGIDYISNFDSEDTFLEYSDSGLSLIDVKYFLARVETERAKYFKTTSLEDNDDISYLTPSRAKLGRSTVRINSKTHTSVRDEINTRLYGKSKMPTANTISHAKIEESIPMKDFIENPTQTTRLKNAPETIKTVSKIFKYSRGPQPSTSEITTKETANRKSMNSTEFLDVKSPNSRMNLRAKLPYQLASIRKATSGDETVLKNPIVDPANKTFSGINPDNRDVFKFDYELISKIDVLDGFKDSNIGNPNWVKLTRDKVLNSKSSILLCRITPMDFDFINLNGREEFSDVPIINKYFFIRVSNQEDVIEEKDKKEFLETINKRDRNTDFRTKKNNGIFLIK
jgi:hypothetical protein